MAEALTKSAARNVFYGGSFFFFAIFVGLTAHSHYYMNTIVLITSGWLAALAVDASMKSRRIRARALLAGAMALGFVFVAVKIAEYVEKARVGIGLETDTFFTLYFLLTGFHLLHVLLGIVILALVAMHDSLDNLKTGTAFWHVVDLVWVVMYPLIYLIG